MHPVLFQVGAFKVYSYGFLVALAVLSAYGLTYWRAKKLNLPSNLLCDFVFVFFVAGVVGARGWYVAQHFEDYRSEPWRALWFQEGGLVWYGGFLLAALAGFSFYHTALARVVPKPSARFLADFFAPILAFSHAVGRIGCFMNGCCAPVQLAESACLGLLSAVLFSRSSRPHAEGEVFGWYLFGYAAIRFVLEFWRTDQAAMAGLTLPQWMSLALWLIALFWLIFLRGKKK